jgi:hypothetical protein
MWRIKSSINIKMLVKDGGIDQEERIDVKVALAHA